MRRTGSGSAALLAVLLLGGCALTPPVLDGPSAGSPEAVDGFRDDEVAALLMLADDAGDPRASTVADYRARQDAGLPAVEPVSCRDSAAPVLLLERDAAAEGTVFELPVLFREAPGADLVVEQHARRFASPAEADAFVEALRAARAACEEFASPEGTIRREVVTGDLAVRAVGFASTTSRPDGSVAESFEWVLVAENVVVSLIADLPDEAAAATLREVADDYAARLS